jgi:hypothetical protein
MVVQLKRQISVEGTPNFGSLGDKVTELRNRGYKLKFRREATCLVCIQLNYAITPEKFNVDEFYHFEDNANTDRDRILYAISSTHGLKGILVDASFVYEDNISPEMFKKLNYYENV